MTTAKRLLGIAGMALSLAALAATPTDPIPVPKLTARVIDQTGTLTAPERAGLEEKLRAFEQARGSQVAVLIVPSIGPEAVEEFAGRVTDEWKLGRKGVDDGVLVVIAKQERKIRIHTGRGVQGTLTDALSKRIASDIIAPRFRSGDFAGGIDAGVDAIMKAIEGEQLALPAQGKGQGKVDTLSSYSNFLWLGFFLVPIVGMALRAMVGRFFGAGLTSGVTGLAGYLVFGSLAFGLVAALLAFLFTIFLGSGVASAARRGGWGGGYIPGGFSGGGGSFGSGGGGFSGGGGGFDGGGASGDW
jgi:uncharacterized protein